MNVDVRRVTLNRLDVESSRLQHIAQVRLVAVQAACQKALAQASPKRSRRQW